MAINFRLSVLPILVHTLVVPTCFLLTAALVFIPALWPLLLVLVIIALCDRRSYYGYSLRRTQMACREWVWWKLFASYFPIRLHKTVDLQPTTPPVKEDTLYPKHTLSLILLAPFVFIKKILRKLFNFHKPCLQPQNNGKKYIFVSSPHGIIAMGLFCAMGTESCGWSEKFPGIYPRVMTIADGFFYPFYRNYLLLTGCASVAKDSCLYHLNNNQSICIVVGGTRECMLSQPGKFKLILKNRKGFVKLALQSGASLVPVISFGENDIYNLSELRHTSLYQKFNNFMLKYGGWTIPMFYGRGIFSDGTGMMPFNRPIDVVVGEPMDVPFNPEFTDEDVDYYHHEYVLALTKLFYENVDKYTPGVELEIVG